MSFQEFNDTRAVNYMIVEVPEKLLDTNLLLHEGQWVDSGIKDFKLRVDPEIPQMHQQRHVHIARDKHTNAKNMQASWNLNGSRHDKKTFNTSLASSDTVKNIARQALGLDDNFVLEHLQKTRLGIILEAINEVSVQSHLEIEPDVYYKVSEI